MAQENVKLFKEKLLESEELKAKLKAAGEAYTGDKADAAKIAETVIIPLAKEAGLPFTVEELKAEEEADQQAGALSDKELEAVAGGRLRQNKIGFCFVVGAGIGERCEALVGVGACFGVGWS
jgi:pantothenate synthetase